MTQSTRGVWCGNRNVNTVRTLAAAGFDWLVLDTQHGDIDRAALVELGRALTDAGHDFGVRVAGNDFTLIGAALDAGATTIIVPQVDTADEARSVVAATFYPPAGSRSHGQFSALWAGRYRPPAQANESITCAVMIESAEALSNVEDIAAVPGLSMLFVGPFDLSLSLGVDLERLTEPDGPMATIQAAAERHSLAFGAFAGSVERANTFRAAGVEFVAVASEATVLNAGAAAVLAATV